MGYSPLVLSHFHPDSAVTGCHAASSVQGGFSTGADWWGDLDWAGWADPGKWPPDQFQDPQNQAYEANLWKLLRTWPFALFLTHFAFLFWSNFLPILLLIKSHVAHEWWLHTIWYNDNLVNSISRKEHMALWLHTGMHLVVHLNQQCLFYLICHTWQPILLANCSLLSSPYLLKILLANFYQGPLRASLHPQNSDFMLVPILLQYWGSPSLHTQVTDFVQFKHGE